MLVIQIVFFSKKLWELHKTNCKLAVAHRLLVLVF